jgi:hypothetical protein
VLQARDALPSICNVGLAIVLAPGAGPASNRPAALADLAEGVETTEQDTFLREHACDEMQGVLFSKAVPPGESYYRPFFNRQLKRLLRFNPPHKVRITARTRYRAGA